jgi:hypothetical protein
MSADLLLEGSGTMAISFCIKSIVGLLDEACATCREKMALNVTAETPKTDRTAGVLAVVRNWATLTGLSATSSGFGNR